MTTPALVASTPRPVDVRAIERELAGLWSDPELGDDGAVTRACMSNLLIYCDCDARARDIPAGLAEIAERHPARVLLLIGDAPDLTGEIEAYVSALCHPVAGGRQVCSEHVTIRARDAGRRRLASVARSLVIGDLPTALWWAADQAPPQAGDPFPELAAMSRQVLYDSQAWAHPLEGLVATTRWVHQHAGNRLASDLAWRRLRPWRRALAETVDPAVAPELLAGLSNLTVHYGHDALAPGWLLAGWVAGSLGWNAERAESLADGRFRWAGRGPRGAVSWWLVPRAERRGLVSVELETSATAGANAGPSRVVLSATGETSLEVAHPGTELPSRGHSWPELSIPELVALELPELSPDPNFLATNRALGEMLDRLRR